MLEESGESPDNLAAIHRFCDATKLIQRDAGFRSDIGQLQLASPVPGEHDERGCKDPAARRLLAVDRPGRCHKRHFTYSG